MDALTSNNYPSSLINSIIQDQNQRSDQNQNPENVSISRYVKVPYIRGASERINKALRPF